MKDLRRLHDDITKIIASHLHYYECDSALSEPKTYEEVQDQMQAWIERYRNDPLFHTRVESVTATIMQRVTQDD